MGFAPRTILDCSCRATNLAAGRLFPSRGSILPGTRAREMIGLAGEGRTMRRKLALGSVLLGLAAAWPSGAGASSDIGCATAWTLEAPSFSCGNRIVIGPGNDTRVNLLLLVRDRGGLDGQGLGYTAPEWFAADLGHTFFYWD